MTDNEVIDNQIQTTNSKDSSSQLDDDTDVIFKVSSSSSINTDTQLEIDSCSLTNVHKNNYNDVLNSTFDSSLPYNKDYSPERDLEDLLSIVEPCQDASKASSEVDSGAASDSADTSCAQINLISSTENELTTNEDISSKVSFLII